MRLKLAVTHDGPVLVVSRKEARDIRHENRQAYERRINKTKNARANVAASKRPVSTF